MPREIPSTDAPLSAAGSAAQRAYTNEDHSGAFDRSAEAGRVRPRLRMVVGGAPVIEPVVEDDNYTAAVRESDPGGEGGAEDWLGSLGARPGARMDGGNSKAPFLAVVENGGAESKAKTDLELEPAGRRARNESGRAGLKKLNKSAITKPRSAVRGESRSRGLKKLNKKQIALDWPPAPRGCEWRRSDDGLNLWRCWTEWADDRAKRVKKSRYAGHLSDEAWRIMKEYDHEAFISVIGERLRRHSGR